MKLLKAIFLISICVLLTSCGLKGALYKDDSKKLSQISYNLIEFQNHHL